MHSLANSLTQDCSLKRLDNEQDECILFESLADKKQVLISYDCDFNFEPAFKKGKKAHWALISGIYAPIEAADVSDQIEPIIDLNKLEYNESSVLIERLKSSFRENRSVGGRAFRETVFCVGKQGKSSQYGVWSLKDLIASNRQLSIVDDEKVNDDMFVKPEDRDLGKTLAAQYIVFK